ncbi:hypothetical protein SNE40_005841 [Patella caerulea]|uniref:Uncharacterized protein n=1 Tax=Patella caerulea TaxID=87958 RepID=A0AAN8K2G1_PATCE
MRYSTTKKTIMAIWAVVETLLFGGLIFGWGSVVFVLKDSGVYSHLCDSERNIGFYTTAQEIKGCSEQDSRLSLVFAIDSALYGLGCAVIGQINYKFGTRITRIISSIIFMTGTLLMAFESKSLPWLVFPGLACLGIGGIPLFITNAQIGKLFERGGPTFVALLSGAVSTSAVVELVAKIAYENGFAMKHFYLLLTGLYSMTFVSTFFFLPKDFITKPTETLFDKTTNKKEQITGISYIYSPEFEYYQIYKGNKGKPFKNNNKDLSIEYDVEISKSLPTLKQCLLSQEYILQVYWFSVLQLQYFYFLSSMNPWLSELFHGDQKQVSYYTNALLYLMMGNFILSPIVGALYDWFKHYFKGSVSKKRRELMPAVIPLMCGSLAGVTLAILVSIPSTSATLIPTFSVVVIFRSFVYSSPTSVFSAIFPSQYFGSLFGIMIVSGGILGLFQFALFTWSEATSFLRVNHFLLAVISTTFVHPLLQWRSCRKAEQNVTNNNNKKETTANDCTHPPSL